MGQDFLEKYGQITRLKRGDTTKFIRTADATILELIKAYLISSIFTFIIIGYNIKNSGIGTYGLRDITVSENSFPVVRPKTM